MRYGYWVGPNGTKPSQTSTISAKDVTMSSATNYKVKLQYVDSFQPTTFDCDEQYLSLPLSDVGKVKIFTESPVSAQADRVELALPDLSQFYVAYTFIAPLNDSLKTFLQFQDSSSSEMIVSHNSNSKALADATSVQSICALKDIYVFKKGNQIVSFSQRLVR